MIHALKCATEYFKDVISGKKTFEIRINDRTYEVGDLLALNEYDMEHEVYTGASCLVHIDYILNNSDYCKDGFIVMSIKPCEVRKSGSPYDEIKGYSVPFASYANKKEESSRT